MGADVVAWCQAARAETTAALGASFSQLRLDLVKCFERVPHDLLVTEAREVGYPLPLLRLALAAYKLPRAVAIGGVYSSLLVAERGITAGSGLATTELRVLLLRLLRRIAKKYPSVKLSAYVDDVSTEAVGTAASVKHLMVAVGNDLCSGLCDLRLQLSTTKCQVVASSAAIGADIATGLAAYGVRYVERAKSLGVGIAAGVRRNATVQKQRLRSFRARMARFGALLRSGLSAARIVRSGGSASFTYGDGITGVAPSTLRDRRRMVAAAVSTKTRGKDLNMVLILADDHEGQRLDPAFAAHALPLGQWAEAVWLQWVPLGLMQSGISRARAAVTAAMRPWSVVRGPAAAVIATAARIGWHVQDATTFVTDQGRVLNLTLDPPIVVKREVDDAVRRWRWRQVTAAAPHLAAHGDDTEGACIAPIRLLLRVASRTRAWTAGHQAALRSAVCNAQWPQARLHSAGLAADPFCKYCEAEGVAGEGQRDGDSAQQQQRQRPFQSLAAEPPRGTTIHRILQCGHTDRLCEAALPTGVAFRRCMLARARVALGLQRDGDLVTAAVDDVTPWRAPPTPPWQWRSPCTRWPASGFC